MLLFALHHSLLEEPIAYFTSDLYSIFSKVMYRQYATSLSFVRGLSITICCPPDDIFHKKLLSGKYDSITDSDGKIFGVILHSWFAYITPFIHKHKSSKFYLL